MRSGPVTLRASSALVAFFDSSLSKSINFKHESLVVIGPFVSILYMGRVEMPESSEWRVVVFAWLCGG